MRERAARLVDVIREHDGKGRPWAAVVVALERGQLLVGEVMDTPRGLTLNELLNILFRLQESALSLTKRVLGERVERENEVGYA